MGIPIVAPRNQWWQEYHDWLMSHGGSVTQKFGPTSYPYEPHLFGGGPFHEGVDLGLTSGTPVESPVPYGRVVKVTDQHAARTGGYGNSVEVATDHGVRVLFGHLKSAKVREGQGVAVGDVIGYSDNTGNSSGPHLHMEIRDRDGNLIPIPGNTLQDVYNDMAQLFGADRPYNGQTNPGPASAIPGYWSPYTHGQGPNGLPGGINTTAGGLGAGYTDPGYNPNNDPNDPNNSGSNYENVNMLFDALSGNPGVIVVSLGISVLGFIFVIFGLLALRHEAPVKAGIDSLQSDAALIAATVAKVVK